jgi:hypothetical protein
MNSPELNALSEEEQLIETQKCMADPLYFLNEFGHLIAKNEIGQQVGCLPFKLFDYQQEVMNLYSTEREIIILKARQLGISWVTAGYALWLGMFHKFQRILIISINDTEAQVFLEKVKFIFDNLPEWLKPQVYKRNESTIWFGVRYGYDSDEVGGINSKIESIPTSKTAGTSRSLNLLIVDECAKVEFMDTIYRSAQPALSTIGGQVIMVSTMTVETTSAFFEEMWFTAKKGDSSFRTKFLSYLRYPGHDKEWRSAQIRKLPASQRVLAKQEYPETADEAFQSIGGKYYDVEGLERDYKPRLKDPKRIGYLVQDQRNKIEFRDEETGCIKVWFEPEPFEDYVLGGDPAEGVSQDYTVFAVVRKRDHAVCAIFRSNSTDSEYCAHIAARMATWYNNALAAVECNNTHGGIVNIMLKSIYFNVYYHGIVDRDSGTQTKRWGWQTSEQNRTWILDWLGKLLDGQTISFYDADLYDEFYHFTVNPKNGRGEHKKGRHDDSIFAVAIACWVTKEQPWYDKKKSYQKKLEQTRKRPSNGY